jgi:hypothetical protein
MPFPKNLDELTGQGYRFSGHSNCRGCGATVEWWITPHNKKMPMDVDSHGNVLSHFSTCPNEKDFRGLTGSMRDPDSASR